jgi:ribosomal protein S18 acetylase RimI-like enzyme
VILTDDPEDEPMHHDTVTSLAEQRQVAAGAAVRPLEPDDADRVATLLGRLSPRSRYLRFHRPMSEVPTAVARDLAAVDHRQHEAVGAFAAGSLIGAVHFVRSATCPTRAEISAEVVDEHQRKGIGDRLLRDLAGRAQQNGITHFTATVLAENVGAVSLLRGTGWPIVSSIDGSGLDVVVALPAPAPAAPGDDGPERVAAPTPTMCHALAPAKVACCPRRSR